MCDKYMKNLPPPARKWVTIFANLVVFCGQQKRLRAPLHCKLARNLVVCCEQSVI